MADLADRAQINIDYHLNDCLKKIQIKNQSLNGFCVDCNEKIDNLRLHKYNAIRCLGCQEFYEKYKK